MPQSKSPSSYQAWTRIDEIGKDGKQIEGSQTSVPTVHLGNGTMAKMYGSQMYDLFVREGWHCIFDSHAALNKKPGAAGSGSAQAGGSKTEAGPSAAKPGAPVPGARPLGQLGAGPQRVGGTTVHQPGYAVGAGRGGAAAGPGATAAGGVRMGVAPAAAVARPGAPSLGVVPGPGGAVGAGGRGAGGVVSGVGQPQQRPIYPAQAATPAIPGGTVVLPQQRPGYAPQGAPHGQVSRPGVYAPGQQMQAQAGYQQSMSPSKPPSPGAAAGGGGHPHGMAMQGGQQMRPGQSGSPGPQQQHQVVQHSQTPSFHPQTLSNPPAEQPLCSPWGMGRPRPCFS